MRFVKLCLSHLPLSLFGKAIAVQATGKTFINSIGMEFILIPAGSFLMGSDKEKETYAQINETPQHRVGISKPFYLGKCEVTQKQWEAVMGNNPGGCKRCSNPVVNVSWDDVQVFIHRLNEREGHDRCRLPTEAEWEYACRAGTKSRYSFGDDSGSLDRYAWYGKGIFGRRKRHHDVDPHPVGQKLPNPWGLYDMHGNVWEWVQDWYDTNYYQDSPSIDPTGPSLGLRRVSRGGAWHCDTLGCRSAYRDFVSPDSRNLSLGFRLAFSPK
jgi:formylglycine-generating enzyme required for sulfatase activity